MTVYEDMVRITGRKAITSICQGPEYIPPSRSSTG